MLRFLQFPMLIACILYMTRLVEKAKIRQIYYTLNLARN